MNNAATSWQKAPGVAEAVFDALVKRPGAANRGGIEHFDVFSEVRTEMAHLLGVSYPNNIALGCNATWALNAAIFGYPFEPGDTVLTTCSEHNSVLRVLHELKSRLPLNIVYLETDLTGRILPETWSAALKSANPKLAIFTHASNVTGAVNDAAALSKAAKAAGAHVLVDVSQTCGIEEIDVNAWDADIVVFTGHKYLLGPQGTGGLYVKPSLTLKPYIIGGTGSHSDLPTMPENMPARLEAGTGNEPSFHGLLAALKWSKANPLRKEELGNIHSFLSRELAAAGADIICPTGPCTPTFSFNIPGMAPSEVGFILEESYDIICRTGLHCAPKIFKCIERAEGTVRLSLSRFTTMEEAKSVVQAVKDIADAV